jgi:hypothetical protein
VSAVALYEVPEDDRQAVILALARLAAERPGWTEYLHGVAARFNGATFFDRLRAVAEDPPPSDRVARKPCGR